MTRISIAAALIVGMASAAVWSAEPLQDRYKDYYMDANYQQFMCKIERLTAIDIISVNVTLPDNQKKEVPDWMKCIRNQKEKLKSSYAVLVKTLKKPAAISSFKDLYIKQILRLDGLSANSEELKILYDQRQIQNENEVSRSWLIFDTER